MKFRPLNFKINQAGIHFRGWHGARALVEVNRGLQLVFEKFISIQQHKLE